MFRPRTVLIVLLGLVGVVALSAFAPAAAAAPTEALHPHAPGRLAEIVSIAGATLDVRARSGTDVKVITNSQTIFRIIGDVDPELDDLAVGDWIVVRGAVTGQGGQAAVVQATHIGLVPDGEREIGRIGALGEDTLELIRPSGPLTVKVTADAWVSLGSQDLQWAGDPPGRDELSEGMVVAAFGEQVDERTFTAHTLIVRPARPVAGRPFAGTIDGVGDDSFSMSTPAGRALTVQVTDQTRYRLPGVDEPGLDDLQVGDEVAVLGRPISETTLQAQVVGYRPERPAALAEIQSINGNRLVLVTRGDREVRAQAGPETVYFIPGNPEANLDDFAAGDTVLAVGERAGASEVFKLTHLAKRAND